MRRPILAGPALRAALRASKSAVVMDAGGYSSHVAIVARVFGIPSVVNIPVIMTTIAPDDQVAVDGDLGWAKCH